MKKDINIIGSLSTRREFIERMTKAGLLLAAAPTLSACSSSIEFMERRSFNELNKRKFGDEKMEDIRSLIYYASLAPSGHNTQPWKFAVQDNVIRIIPDYSRSLPIVDPDHRELFISLGTAVENLVIAAKEKGFHPEVSCNLDENNEYIEIVLNKDQSVEKDKLFTEIKRRQSSRNEYNGKSVPSADLNKIESGLETKGTGIEIYTDATDIKKITEYVSEGNRLQFSNDDFVDELQDWIRFSKSSAEETRDGIASFVTGNPNVPAWLGRIFMDLFHTTSKQVEEDEKKIKSSAGLVLISSDSDDKRAWIETGRMYERYSLLTTSMNIKNAFCNQPIEVKKLRPEFGSAVAGRGRHAQLLLRFGYAEPMPQSLRRPIDEMIIELS